MFSRACSRLFNIIRIKDVSFRDLSQRCSTFKETFTEKRYIYGSILLATSVFSYIGCKEKFTALKYLLISREDMYNLIPDVVDVSVPSVVLIETQNESCVNPLTGQPISMSKASGFIVKEDGLIITNAHVFLNIEYTSIIVRLMDGTTYTGYLEDLDITTDLATLRIHEKNLPTMKLGSSSKIRLGEWVIAMGSLLTLKNSVTAGVVSSTHRASEELGIKDRDMEYIQTDAYISFGNSGGPLVNMNAEAIGINTFKTGMGLAFAIPIDYVKDFLEKCASNSYQYMHKTLGITMLLITKNLYTQLRIWNPDLPDDVESGVFVWNIIHGSPAYNGGLRIGDVVVGVNGIPVKSSKDIYSALETAKGPLMLQIVRGSLRTWVAVTPNLN